MTNSQTIRARDFGEVRAAFSRVLARVLGIECPAGIMTLADIFEMSVIVRCGTIEVTSVEASHVPIELDMSRVP